MAVSLFCIIALSCCANQARVFPNNYLFLGVFTLAESVLLGIVSAAYQLDSVVLAVAMTAALTSGLVLFAQTTKSDFTGAGPYLFMALWGLLLFGLFAAFFPSVAQGRLFF
jgi:FtsH-binding integral membrane protein